MRFHVEEPLIALLALIHVGVPLFDLKSLLC